MNERRMELLAPAGDESALRAAVQNGADAVYLGAGAFNARRHAGNFDGEALDAAVGYCHARGVKVHVTLNTLVRQDEFAALEAAVEAVYRSGADAVIVQDFGVARALREMAPGIQLHASTQMAVHNRQGVAFVREQGFQRAVLARELTFGEMAECAREGIEIETFVHGALCVACSGQCLMSSMVGGRSGNRGLCAQPCRLPWRLEDREGYLLSTKDLCAIDRLAELRDAGVASLKIEGRLKRAEYVAETVAAYRRALDALYVGEGYDPEPDRRDMAQMFNRGGFTQGYGPGVAESDLMYPARPNHIGARVGLCPRDGEVALEAEVLAADALALRGRGGEDIPVKLSGAAGQRVKCPKARKGDGLYRLVSEAQMRRARESFESEHRQVPVAMTATLKVGRPAMLTASDGEHAVEATGETVQLATSRGLDRERTVAQLCKTGGTAYRVTDVKLDADENAFCPASMLNALRRDALAKLEAARTAVLRAVRPMVYPPVQGANSDKPILMAQSGDAGVLRRALACGADLAVYSPEDLRNMDTVDLPERFALAVPGVLTAGALDGLRRWAMANRDRIAMTFLSNVGQLGLDWPGTLAGDYLLNAASNVTVGQLNEWGLEWITPSVELNAGQIGELSGRTNLIVWGRVPLMHLRHCPLRAAEGMKGRHATCRHCDSCPPGERLNGRRLVDRRGAAFPLNRLAMAGEADGAGGCVIQVLNSVPLMPLKRLERLPKTSGWRLLLRSDEPVEAVVKVYRAALDGEDFKRLPEWDGIERMNTTTGHYFRGVE